MKRRRLLLILAIVVGAAIRLYNLGAHNLWFDELFSLRFSNIFNFQYIISNGIPGAYPALLHFWIVCFGKSEFALRSLSLLFGLLTILFSYKVGKAIFGAETGLVCAFIISLSPLHIWYSQEARYYSLSTLLVLMSFYYYFLALKKDRIHLWLMFAGLSIVSLYTNYFSLFVIFVGSILIIVMKEYRHLLKRWLITCCAVLTAFLPQVIILLSRLKEIHENFWIPKPSLESIVATFQNFNIGYNVTYPVYILSSIIFFVLFALGISRWRNNKNEIIILLSFLLIPIITVFFLSQWIPVYIDRQLMLFSPFYYLVIARGFLNIRLVSAKTAVSVVTLFLISLSLHNYFSYQMSLPEFYHKGAHLKKPVKPAADYINHNFKFQDAIFLSNINIINIIYYFFDKNWPFFIIVSKDEAFGGESYIYRPLLKFKGISSISREDSPIYAVVLKKNNSVFSKIPAVSSVVNACKFRRIWLISSSWERDGRIYAQSLRTIEWFNAHYTVSGAQEIDGIYIILYLIKPQF